MEEMQIAPKMYVSKLLIVFVALGSFWGCSRSKKVPGPTGEALFAQHCSKCHFDGNDMRAPVPEALRDMSSSVIFSALESGPMRWEAKSLSKAEKAAIADYLGKPMLATSAKALGMCPRDLDPPPNLPTWSGWGVTPRNTRFQSRSIAGLDRESVKNLKLKWAFGFPGAAATFGQPTSYGGKLFVGSEDGTVYALDAATGCEWWAFHASATVKTAVSVDRGNAFFGDINGFVYAVRVADGSLVWRVRPAEHPAARITGSPLLLGARLYVPISSGEEGAAADPHYPCCSFRGSVVALDAASGKTVWRAYTIDQPAKPTRKNSQGIQFYGPSGAAVWSPPTADLRRHVLYVATGNNYALPATDTSDAVMAFDLRTGRKIWQRQLTPKDLWNSGCVAEQKDNCPEQRGADLDFGAPPLLQTLPDGRDVLLLAQKSGVVYALDPDQQGQILWSRRIGHGGPLGGIQWGGASDRRHAYFPLSDLDDVNPLAGGGLFALNLRSGKQVWYVPPPKPACAGIFGCSAGQMAPPSVIPGVVFSGSLDGHLRAYDTRDGSLLWDFDTAREFPTTNNVKAHGGSMNASGPTIVSGMLYVNSGYTNGRDGNVLLAFAVNAP
jgi:polyvinyl alcohol dehydrogenase (cytochrome)